MSSAVFDIVNVAAVLGSALVAGFFFSFSAVNMKALGRLPAEQGIAAMQSINIVVLNPWFFTAFFGTAVACVILAAYATFHWHAPSATYLLAGSVLYLGGVILVTILFNVPLNDALAVVKPESAAGAELWTRYLTVWTVWNHVRTVAPLLAASSFLMALRY